MVLAAVANSYVRETQLQYWVAADPLTQSNVASSFSTADFLGHARHIKFSFNEKRAYPNNLETTSQQSKSEPLTKRPINFGCAGCQQ